jgi:hypothetical protein
LLDEVPAILREKLAHGGIDVVGIHAEAAFRKEPSVNSRSRAEVKQRTALRDRSKDSLMKRGARATIRFERGDVLEIFLTGVRMSECILEPRRRNGAHDDSATGVAVRPGFSI